ncbi:unnamed protein product [Camellia sinensis]
MILMLEDSVDSTKILWIFRSACRRVVNLRKEHSDVNVSLLLLWCTLLDSTSNAVFGWGIWEGKWK